MFNSKENAKMNLAIRLRMRLLLNRKSRWNSWVRSFTAWLEKIMYTDQRKNKLGED
jgi:hypothetical protein